MPLTRRRFLTAAGTAAAGTALLPHTLYGRSRPAADRLRLGTIGVKGMGWTDTNAILGVDDNTEVAWFCDVDPEVLADRLTEYKGLRQNTPQTTGDYRKVIEDPNVDIVVIGTPDHWHARMFADAMAAGKHVYVEKPVANTVEECRAMVAAQAASGLVVQVGQWQRSGAHYAKAMDVVRSGVLGDIRLVKCWAYQGWMLPGLKVPDTAPPPGVDYAMWLGPAPTVPFNPSRFHFDFRWFWDYAGGLMTDWGVHEIDIALLAMGATAPKSVMASGVKDSYPEHLYQTPDTMQATFEYEGFTMLWEHALGIDGGPYGRGEGIAFIGNNGTLVLNREGYEILPEREFVGWDKPGEGAPKMADADTVAMARPEGANYVAAHAKNFVDCVRANTPDACATTIASGAVAAINAQLGSIAYKTGAKLYWDEAAGDFRNNAEASKLLRANYHNGWEVPGRA